jgi:hypothetical protein
MKQYMCIADSLAAQNEIASESRQRASHQPEQWNRHVRPHMSHAWVRLCLCRRFVASTPLRHGLPMCLLLPYMYSILRIRYMFRHKPS